MNHNNLEIQLDSLDIYRTFKIKNIVNNSRIIVNQNISKPSTIFRLLEDISSTCSKNGLHKKYFFNNNLILTNLINFFHIVLNCN